MPDFVERWSTNPVEAPRQTDRGKSPLHAEPGPDPTDRILQGARDVLPFAGPATSAATRIRRMTSSENELGDAGTVHATTTGSTSAEGGRAVQTALVVGASNDSYEQEADRVADHVMTTLTTRTTDAPPSDRFRKSANNRIRRMTSPTGEAGGAVDADTERAIASERSTGTQLPAQLRHSMESAMGADFSQIRLHVNTRSDDLNRRIQSRAFTSGSDVFVRRKDYAPDTPAGQRLLAHELVHTVQQGAAALVDSTDGVSATAPSIQRIVEHVHMPSGNPTVGAAQPDLHDEYMLRYIFQELRPQELKALKKQVLAEHHNSASTNGIGDAESATILSLYEQAIDSVDADQTWEAYNSAWAAATADPSLTNVQWDERVNFLSNGLNAKLVPKARTKYKRIDIELTHREKSIRPTASGLITDEQERNKFASALKAFPALKELIADVKDGGKKTPDPEAPDRSASGFGATTDPSNRRAHARQHVNWQDKGPLTEKIVEVDATNTEAPLVSVTNGKDANWQKAMDLKMLKQDVQRADAFYRQITEKSVLAKIPRPEIRFHLATSLDRMVKESLPAVQGKSYYGAWQANGVVHLAAGVNPEIVVHEIGHYVENSIGRNEWLEIELFLRGRHAAAGGGVLQQAPTGSTGQARQLGDFPATGSYTSVTYTVGTEVTSMTLEKLAKASDIDDVIDKDPQQVATVIRALRPNDYRAHEPLRRFDRYLH